MNCLQFTVGILNVVTGKIHIHDPLNYDNTGQCFEKNNRDFPMPRTETRLRIRIEKRRKLNSLKFLSFSEFQ